MLNNAWNNPIQNQIYKPRSNILDLNKPTNLSSGTNQCHLVSPRVVFSGRAYSCGFRSPNKFYQIIVCLPNSLTFFNISIYHKINKNGLFVNEATATAFISAWNYHNSLCWDWLVTEAPALMNEGEQIIYNVPEILQYLHGLVVLTLNLHSTLRPSLYHSLCPNTVYMEFVWDRLTHIFRYPSQFPSQKNNCSRCKTEI